MNTLKCFLIDDEPAAHRLFKIAVQQTGLTVQCYEYFSGIEALAQLKGSIYPIPDIIFLDVSMPRMNGLDFLKEIKAIDRLKHIPVCMFSVDDFSVTENEARRLGAADYILKLSNPDLQAQVLKSVLGRFSSQVG